ncbi:MAG: cytochrome c biogenesis protein [Dehalococcoidia bacterium]|nr:cytochrome c biogenesis protein [Dehalococcoidia bacterium]
MLRLKILLVASTLLMLVALFMVFVSVPTDAGQGVIQRIFYFHVPVAWVAFFAFFITFVAGIVYLTNRSQKWDMIASASAEIGLVFTTLILITGSIWARPVWGVWWTWDARLTASLVLWLIYLSYFIIRSYISDEDRRARFAAVVGIIGFVDVPVVALSIQLSRTQHPPAMIFQGGLAGSMSMLATLLVSVAAFTVLYALLMEVRVRIKKDEREIKKLKEACADE